MSRMMPAKVRSEGIKLYKKGLVLHVEIEDFKLRADIGKEAIVYDLDGQSDICSCEEFSKTHRYCIHVAAVEEYLRREAGEEVEASRQEKRAAQLKSKSFQTGKDFLEQVNADLAFEMVGHLTLEVNIFDATTSGLFLGGPNDFLAGTLKLKEEQEGRSYIIRDIPVFLQAVKQGESYGLGQKNFTRLSLDDFDLASQGVLSFLLQIQIDDYLFGGSLYRKNGRYLVLPFLLVHRFLELVQELEGYKIEIEGENIQYASFVTLDQTSDLFSFIVRPLDDKIELEVEEAQLSFIYKGRILYSDHVFYQLTDAQVYLLRKIARLDYIDGFRKVEFSYDDKDDLAQALEAFKGIGTIFAPSTLKIEPFRPVFAFSMDNQVLRLRLSFEYKDFTLVSFHELETLEFSRNLRLEKKIFDLMILSGFPVSFDSARPALKVGDLYKFYEETIPAFQNLGRVELDQRLTEQEIISEPEINVSTEGSLLDISFQLPNVEGTEMARILEEVSKDASFVITSSGRFIKLDHRFDLVKQAMKDFPERELSGTHLKASSFRAFQVSQIFEAASGVTFSDKFTSLFHDLTHPEEFKYQKPKALKADLRSYQEDGVRWMSMLTHYGMGGILADDMGLGKTLQAITYLLSTIKKSDKVLVVAPSSLLYNWEAEFAKFSGKEDLVVVEGLKAGRDEMIGQTHQIYVTSYGSFLKDLDLYQALGIDYLLLDEAQVVKNFNSKTNRALSKLRAKQIFALSGTPIENKLDEIWAIFNIVMPGLLSDRKNFVKKNPQKIMKQIAPFVLRRKKEDVLTELPNRLEMTQLSELTDQQKVIYLGQLDSMQKRVQGMNSLEFSRNRMEILAGITRLRQICDSPSLFMENYRGGSGKMDSLRTLMEQVKSSGRRPLIFSQFTKIFPMVEDLLAEVGLTSYKLTGSTPSKERIEMVRAFNAGSRDAFLISLKAGGTGLNLASSDMVILIDLWWNPAVEDQAISRAHRMGQKKMVEVIRLITKGTIEEKIIEIQNRKKDLFTAILDNSDTAQSLSQADINEILLDTP